LTFARRGSACQARGILVDADALAAALEQENVPPDAVHLAEPLAPAHQPETDSGVNTHAGFVLGKDARL
jgi:hypothetical protein